jgi:prepilin-type N-terminal cleavage/methylation domain-containing protein
MTLSNLQIEKAARREARGFTLIELLVVIAIIAVLTAVTTMSIGSLGQGRKLTTGGNLVVDLINHARQVAKSRNTLTMVTAVTGGDEAGLALATFAFSATNGTSGSWTPLDAWRTLPDGITLDLASSTNFFTAPPSSSGTLTRGGEAVEYQSAVFLPDGRMLSSSSTPHVLYVKPKWSTGPAPTLKNYYKIVVNPATGIPIIRRP